MEKLTGVEVWIAMIVVIGIIFSVLYVLANWITDVLYGGN